MSDAKEYMKDLDKLDLAELPAELRHMLHRALYRQECRAVLLAIGLISSGYLLVNLDTTFSSFVLKNAIKWYLALVTVFLVFWVIYPSQRILIKLRKLWKVEDGNIEGKFDDSWHSLWDFVPPLLLPLGGWIIFLLLQAMNLM